MSQIVMDRPEGKKEEKVAHKVRRDHVKEPKDPWKVEIDVYLNSVGPAPTYTPDFEIETPLPIAANGSDPNGRVGFYNEGRSAGFEISFRLFDNTTEGTYRFPNTDSDGVWSQLGTTCPQSAIYDVFPQDGINVKDKGQTLIALNPNPTPAQGDFQYTLNVSTTGDPPYVHLDPGGNNMDSGSSRD